MNRRFYQVTRDLHLYLGLFASPFILVFAVTVFFFVHSWIPKLSPDKAVTRSASLTLSDDLLKLSGRPLIDALSPILERAGISGEIGFIQRVVKEEKLIIPVSIPGRATTVTINLANHEATITTRETGLADALMTLHKSPGEHAPSIRMNWLYMKAWRWLADTTAYLTLFITVSGIYLWYVLRAERRIGCILLFAGTLTFFGLAYVISH